MKTWRYQPNWRDSVDVNLTFNTDVITARSGREQRRALRHTPRRQLRYSVTLSNDEIRTLRRDLTTWQSKEWFLPDPTRRVVTSTGASSGATQIYTDSLPAWLALGQSVIVGDEEPLEITAVDINQYLITLSGPFVNAVPAGAYLRPALEGRLGDNIDVRRPSSGAALLRISFDVTPGSETLDDGLPSYDVLSGREVFLSKANWGNDVTDSFSWASETVDFNFGVTATYNPLEYGTVVRQETFLCENTAESEYIEKFFARQRGRRGEFLKPTWINDLPPVSNLASGTNYIRTAGTEAATDYADDAIYRSVAVILRDGTRLYRQVQSLETIDGIDTLVRFTSTWPSTIAASDIFMVCWMPVTRFSSDTLTIQHLTDQVSRIQLSTQSLEYLAAEDPLPNLNPAAPRFDSSILKFDSTGHTMDEG